MSAPDDDNEQELERLLRDLYDMTYEASTLPTPTTVWAGVAPRLLHASQADNTHNHAHPSVTALTDQAVTPDAVGAEDSVSAAPPLANRGSVAGQAPPTVQMRPMKLSEPKPDAPHDATLRPDATPNRGRATPAWRRAPRPWTLPRMAAPLVAAAVIVSLLVGVFIALGFRRGVSTQAAAPHPCLQPAPTTTSGVIALALNSGDTVLLRASDGKQLWRVHTGYPTNTPVIVGDVVYVVARNNDLSALRLSDGSQIWNTLAASQTNFGLVASEPLVVNCGVVLVNTANGGVAAVQASNGARLWSYQDYPAPTNAHGVAYPYQGVAALLTAGDGVVYVMSQRVSGSALTRTLTWTIKALRETDGRLLWQTSKAQPDDPYRQANTNPNTQIQSAAAPFTGAVLGHTLYLMPYATHPALMAFADQSGALLWQRPMSSDISPYQTLADTLVGVGPYLYLAQITQVCQLTPMNGSIRRCFQTTPYGATSAITQSALYIPIAGKTDPTITIRAIRASDGARLWSWDVPRVGSFFPALVFQGSVATTGVVGVITSVAIFGVRASDGSQLWSWSPPGAFTHPDTDTYTITGATAR